MAIVILICYLVYRRHQKRNNRVVIREAARQQQQLGLDMNSGTTGNNRIIMQDVQVSEIGGLASGIVGTPMDNDSLAQSHAAH